MKMLLINTSTGRKKEKWIIKSAHCLEICSLTMAKDHLTIYVTSETRYAQSPQDRALRPVIMNVNCKEH
jgi:hypothetical protein